METMTKRAAHPESRPRSVKGIDLFAQEVGMRVELVLSHRQKKQSRQSTQHLQQLFAAAQGQVPVASPLTLTVFRLQQQVQEFRALQVNWDTYGAEPIQEVAIRQAQRILHALSIQLASVRAVSLHAFPMRDGGVQLDVDRNGRSMEVEVHPDGTAEYLLFNSDGEWLDTYSSLTTACRQFASPVPSFAVS